MRPITLLAITIPKYSGSREDFEEWLVLNWDGRINRYCIAQEKHVDDTMHLHAFVQLPDETEDGIDRIIADEVTRSLEVWLDKGANVQACRSAKTWIKYITKEDENAILSDVSPHECSLYLQTALLAKKEKFKWNHPHVAAHANTAHVVRNMWDAFRRQHAEPVRCERVQHPLPLELGEYTWMRNAINIINNYIEYPTFKKPHVYLWGPPNCGKSTFVNYLLDYMNWKPVFPLKNKSAFWLAQVDEDHHVILMDDFRPDDYTLSDLLNLLQGGWMSRQRKGIDPESFQWRKPIIITSNVPFVELVEPLQVRLTPVLASLRDRIN